METLINQDAFKEIFKQEVHDFLQKNKKMVDIMDFVKNIYPCII